MRAPCHRGARRRGVVEVGSHDQLMAAKGFGHDRCMTGSEVTQRPPAVVAVQHEAHRACPAREQPAGLVWPPSVASGEGFGLQPLEL